MCKVGQGSRGGSVGRSGHAIEGQSARGWAGWFEGKVHASRYLEIGEISTPASPTAHNARLFVRANAANHLQLCVRFPNGVVRVLATA